MRQDRTFVIAAIEDTLAQRQLTEFKFKEDQRSVNRCMLCSGFSCSECFHKIVVGCCSQRQSSNLSTNQDRIDALEATRNYLISMDDKSYELMWTECETNRLKDESKTNIDSIRISCILNSDPDLYYIKF